MLFRPRKTNSEARQLSADWATLAEWAVQAKSRLLAEVAAAHWLRLLPAQNAAWDCSAMDAMDALDASADRAVELAGQVGQGQWGEPTPCSQWNVRTLVGHLIATRQAYCALLAGASAADLMSFARRQGEAAGGDPVAMLRRAVRSVRAAFEEPGALERIVHHPAGDIAGSQLLALLVMDSVIHSWDLATAIGVDAGLDEQLVDEVYSFLAPRAEGGGLYAGGSFAAPARPLPDGATSLQRLIHLAGR